MHTSSPRIYFFGDVHGQFQHVLNVVQRDRPDAIVLLGDLEPTQPLDVELGPILDKTIVRFIHGNHDTDSWENYQNVFHCAISHWNLHGRVEEICGVKIGGIGGVFRQRIWFPPAAPAYRNYEAFYNALNGMRPERERKMEGVVTSAKEREHCSSIFPDTLGQLEIQRADILVTHEAPGCHEHGFSAIDDVAKKMRVKVAVHGHHHQCLAYHEAWQTLGFQAYGVGLHAILALEVNSLSGQ